MRRLLWPLGLVLAFGLGWAAGGWPVHGPFTAQEVAQLRASESRLQLRVSSLEARLRAGGGFSTDRTMERRGPRPCRRGPARRGAPWPEPRRMGTRRWAFSSREAAPTSGPRVLASHRDRRVAVPRVLLRPRTPRWIASIDMSTRRTRWEGWRTGSACNNWPTSCGRWARPGRRCSCRSSRPEPRATSGALPLSSLGSCRSSRRCRLLQNIVEQDSDLPLRRAATAGLRRLQTPETVPVLEALLADSGEDRLIRMSAASGLAQMDRSQGVAGLMQVFESSSADADGRALAFRALTSLNDERALPFMRRLVTSTAEASYRVRAMRFLAGQGDRQALPSLQQVMQSPAEPVSIRDAAAQAHAAIAGR